MIMNKPFTVTLALLLCLSVAYADCTVYDSGDSAWCTDCSMTYTEVVCSNCSSNHANYLQSACISTDCANLQAISVTDVNCSDCFVLNVFANQSGTGCIPENCQIPPTVFSNSWCIYCADGQNAKPDGSACYSPVVDEQDNESSGSLLSIITPILILLALL